ncbi:MutS-related protein [Arthrobacter phoenicis]
MPVFPEEVPTGGIHRGAAPTLGPVTFTARTAGAMAVSVLGVVPDGEGPLFLETLKDLQLDAIIGAVTSGRAGYDLVPFFHSPCRDAETVAFRHEVFRDLEIPSCLDAVERFSSGMQSVREQLAQAGKLHYRLQQQALVLAAARTYCSAVTGLRGELSALGLQSPGFRALTAFLDAYTSSGFFTRIRTEADRIRADLDAVSYKIHIDGGHVSVSPYRDEVDYTAEVEATFARFRQGAVKDYRSKLPTPVELDHVEAQVLDRVAILFADTFDRLNDFCTRYTSFQNPTITRFDREIQFYISYLCHIRPLKDAGLSFCYPEVSVTSKQTSAADAFDLALAVNLVREKAPVVTNDVELHGAERILIVSGPNQGGKTTFARTVGQLHYLAALGVPVPGTRARVFLPDGIYTHFEREENRMDLRGKLEDDLIRVQRVLSQATPRSVIILNEIFTSTTLNDAIYLGREVLGRIVVLDLICVCVTFVEELASVSATTVSMVSTVLPEDPSVRTFKVVRRRADGRAYAKVLARKYGLNYESLKERIRS